MKKVHIALAVTDFDASVKDYSRRLATQPAVVVAHEYALWRVGPLNLSIRKTNEPGVLRHLGFEVEIATEFTTEKDVNGRPRPRPCAGLVLKKGSKTRDWFSCAIPTPLSVKLRIISPSRRRMEMHRVLR